MVFTFEFQLSRWLTSGDGTAGWPGDDNPGWPLSWNPGTDKPRHLLAFGAPHHQFFRV